MDFSLLAPDPARIDPAWMTTALRRAGVLKAARVTDLAITPVGNGLVGDSFRFTLTYDQDEAGAPATVVGKFPAANPASRQSGSAHMLYVREVSFYRELASTVAINTPRPYVAEIDPATDDFTLIFEDLAPARQGDQLSGCSIEDARTAMAEAAALHAPRWADPTLEALDWLAIRPAQLQPMVLGALPGIIALFKDRYEGQLEPEFMALVEKLPPTLAAIHADPSSPRTLQHGDFRLDNMLFDVQGGRKPMATLDWQTLALAPGLIDVAYFLSAGIDPQARREHERDLVRFYHDELTRRGVTGFDWEACWRDYRRYTIQGILMGVFSALSVERTERGDQLFLKMTRGACIQAQDHGSFGFWLD
ncbi:MAG: phosphotransferase [Caulobacteraceae bacterium]|nr:phosphotransferase [Caulobacteraceae bacterium]